jgi:hypothetical protein
VELRPEFGLSSGGVNRSRLKPYRKLLVVRAVTGSAGCGGEDQNHLDESVVKSERLTVTVKDPVAKFHGMISSFPPLVFVVNFSFLILH